MILIYLSPVPWNSIAQRPHFFAKSVLDNQSVDKVYWVEPTPSRLPKLSDIRRLFSKIEPTSFSLPADLTIINTKYCIPLEPLPKLFKLINYFFINSILSEIDTLYSIHKKENIILVVG
ncbi:hypothetical protein, partial [Gallibacterium anatis]|uniref:hypothetical protein n=1 Tax=Gallibacterium anatis TaxID=750 RepID=UPI001E583CBF